MLKICEQKGVGDQFNAEQFYHLSLLMTVRLHFNRLLLLIIFSTVKTCLTGTFSKVDFGLVRKFLWPESVVLSRQNYVQ